MSSAYAQGCRPAINLHGKDRTSNASFQIRRPPVGEMDVHSNIMAPTASIADAGTFIIAGANNPAHVQIPPKRDRGVDVKSTWCCRVFLRDRDIRLAERSGENQWTCTLPVGESPGISACTGLPVRLADRGKPRSQQYSCYFENSLIVVSGRCRTKQPLAKVTEDRAHTR